MTPVRATTVVSAVLEPPRKVNDMYKSTRTTRTLATLGAGAVVSLALCFPAGAADGDGPPPGVDVGRMLNDIDTPPGAADGGGPPPGVDVGRMLNDIDTPPGRPEQTQSSSTPPATGDDPLEYDQVVLGALGGVTLVGLSFLAIQRRRGHDSPRLT